MSKSDAEHNAGVVKRWDQKLESWLVPNGRGGQVYQVTEKCLPVPTERDNDSLVDLCLQLYARSGMYPDSKEMHDAWVEAVAELKRRLGEQDARLYSLLSYVPDGVKCGELQAKAEEFLSLRAEIDRLKEFEGALLSTSGKCKFCGQSLDVPKGHVDRCYCIPRIKQLMEEVSILRTQLAEANEKLRVVERDAKREREWKERDACKECNGVGQVHNSIWTDNGLESEGRECGSCLGTGSQAIAESVQEAIDGATSNALAEAERQRPNDQ